MKKKLPLPCLIGWIVALLLGLLVLIPMYFYLRLMAGLLGLIVAGYCLIHMLKKKLPRASRAAWWCLTVLVALAVGIFTVTGSLILYGGQGDPEANCPYIVVLGAQVRSYGPSESLQERIDAAYGYLTGHPDTVAIVSGGQGDDEHISEALCMYQALTDMGIEPDRLIMEDRATSTWENLSYSLDIIEARTGSRPDSIGVVSSEYHLYRTGLQAKEHGLTVQGIPAKTGSFDRFLHYFIREIAGVWHYLILGGQYV